MDISPESKLTIVCHIEAGWLGPRGDSLIQGFCAYAQGEFDAMTPDFIAWCVIPRTDITQPELQFQVAGKAISREQAARYLARYGESIDEIQTLLDGMLTQLVEEYQGR
jgi:hypothetical protein